MESGRPFQKCEMGMGYPCRGLPSRIRQNHFSCREGEKPEKLINDFWMHFGHTHSIKCVPGTLCTWYGMAHSLNSTVIPQLLCFVQHPSSPQPVSVLTLKTNISPRRKAMVSKWPLQMSGLSEGRSDLRVGRGAGGFGTSPDREPADGLLF